MSRTRRQFLLAAGSALLAGGATACARTTPASPSPSTHSPTPTPGTSSTARAGGSNSGGTAGAGGSDADGSTPTPEALEPNLDQVVRGDYATLNGTWRAPCGQELTIKHALVSWVVDGMPFAEINDLQFTPAGGATTASDGAIVLDGVGIVPWFYTGADSTENSSALYVFPTGTPLTLPDTQTRVPSDETQPRILALPGNAAAADMPKDLSPFIATRTI